MTSEKVTFEMEACVAKYREDLEVLVSPKNMELVLNILGLVYMNGRLEEVNKMMMMPAVTPSDAQELSEWLDAKDREAQDDPNIGS